MKWKKGEKNHNLVPYCIDVVIERRVDNGSKVRSLKIGIRQTETNLEGKLVGRGKNKF